MLRAIYCLKFFGHYKNCLKYVECYLYSIMNFVDFVWVLYAAILKITTTNTMIVLSQNSINMLYYIIIYIVTIVLNYNNCYSSLLACFAGCIDQTYAAFINIYRYALLNNLSIRNYCR